MIKKALLSICLFLLSPGKSLYADTIGLGGCGSCLGSSYTLIDTTTANPDGFDIFLAINTTGFTNANTELLNAVSLELVVQDSDVTAAGQQNGIASEDITLTQGNPAPEPSTFLLLGTGLLAAAAIIRKIGP